MFWTELQSAMILKLLIGHGLNLQVRSTIRYFTGSHIWLMLLIQPHSGLTTPAPTAQPHVPPHCGQISCAHHVLISELPWGLLTAPNSRAQRRTQRAIKTAQPQWSHIMNPRRSCLFVWLAGLPGAFDWPASVLPIQGHTFSRSQQMFALH